MNLQELLKIENLTNIDLLIDLLGKTYRTGIIKTTLTTFEKYGIKEDHIKILSIIITIIFLISKLIKSKSKIDSIKWIGLGTTFLTLILNKETSLFTIFRMIYLNIFISKP